MDVENGQAATLTMVQVGAPERQLQPLG